MPAGRSGVQAERQPEARTATGDLNEPEPTVDDRDSGRTVTAGVRHQHARSR